MTLIRKECILFLIFITPFSNCDDWLEPLRSRLKFVNELDNIPVQFFEFAGNVSFESNFKLLEEEDSSILVGSRNNIYNLSLPNLQEVREETIKWNCRPEDEELCYLKGKSSEDCQNYIQVMAVLEPSSLVLICGTNCYSPICRHYRRKAEGGYEVEKQFRGRGYAPYHPSQNSSFLYTSGHLYAATVADFSGMDALIMKDQLRTEQYDFRHLNAPNFVSTLEDEDYVYFFFREVALEVMNCGKSIYSRVARVCKSDEGGSHRFINRWTTFLKARINCSVPGDYPFYFDEIQSTTNFFASPGSNQVFYAVFTTPENSIPGSAICRFSMDDVLQSFDSDFQNQESANSHWLPLAPSQVPSPRPGKCNNQSSSLPESNLHFIKNHCLMEKAVSSSPSMPVFIRSSDSELLTKIAIHPGVSDLHGNLYDILFVGTNRGRVITILTSSDVPDIRTSEVLEELQIFNPTEPVLSLKILAPAGPSPQLIIVSANSVKAIHLHKCHKKLPDSVLGCRSCVSQQWPYCAWDMVSGTCVEHHLWSNKTQLVQAENECPTQLGDQWGINFEDELLDEVGKTERVRDKKELSFEMVENYTKELILEQLVVTSEVTEDPHFISVNLVLISVATGLVSLFLGFVAGLLASRLCANKFSQLGKSSEDSVDGVNISTFNKRRNTNEINLPINPNTQPSTNDAVVDIPAKPIKQDKTSEISKKVKRMYI